MSKTNTPRIPVVDENGAFIYLGVICVSNATNVVSVTEGKEGKDADGTMFNGMDTPHEMKALSIHPLINGGFYFHPEADGLKGLRGQVQGEYAHQFLAGQGPLLITDDPFCHLNPTFTDEKLTLGSGTMNLDDLGLFLSADPREIFELRLVGNNVLFFEVKVINQVLSGPMQINGPWVTLRKGPEPVNGSYGLTCLPFKNRIALTHRSDIDLEMGIALGGKPGGFPVGRA